MRFVSTALAALRGHDVHYVILHRGGYGPNKWARIDGNEVWLLGDHLGTIRNLAGSGRKGRITYQDVEQASKPARAVGGGTANAATRSHAPALAASL